jgi:hypothetical protein
MLHGLTVPYLKFFMIGFESRAHRLYLWYFLHLGRVNIFERFYSVRLMFSLLDLQCVNGEYMSVSGTSLNDCHAGRESKHHMHRNIEIRIRPFTSKRIRILSKVIQKLRPQHRDSPRLHFESQRLDLASAGFHSSILSLNSS